MASLILAFFIIQYFLINKEISVTSDLKRNIFKKSCVFGEFCLKCLLRSTELHQIDYTFLFLSYFFSKVIWRGGGGG